MFLQTRLKTWKQVADSNAEWSLNSIYICWKWAAMSLTSRDHGCLSVSLATSTGKSMQTTQWRGSVFIVCIYSHVWILLRQGSQTHILMVTRHWPGMITREWWGMVLTGELMPRLRCNHLTTYGNALCCQIIPFLRRCSNFNVHVNFPDFKTLCVRWSRSFGVNLTHGQPICDPLH